MRTPALLLACSFVGTAFWAAPALAQPNDVTTGGEGDEVAVLEEPLRPVAAEQPAEVTLPPLEEDVDEERPAIWQDYTGYWDWKFEELLSKPLWGNTTNLPQGILKFRYEYTHARGQTYYDGDGNEVQLLPVISFNDFGAPGRVLVVDPRLSGEGGEHNFQIAYGITDPWDLFVELPFTQAKTTLDLRTYADGQPLDTLQRRVFENFIEANGRPLPGEEWETPVSLGDMRVGMSVNYFRNDFFSAGVVPSVRLPTGHPADPNNDVTYLRGPEIDRGVGAFSTNITSVFDLRPFKWLVFSFEAAANYQFGYDRPAPQWLPITDCRRLQDPDRRAAAGCGPGSPDYDRAYDLEQAATFPDLEKLGDTIHVEPTIAYGIVAGITLQLTPIPIQFGYQFDRNEAPTLKATGDEDTAFAFNQMVKSLQLLESTEVHAIALGTSIPLFPLYIPIALQPKAKWVVAGKNLMRLQQQYSIAAELYLPVNDFF